MKKLSKIISIILVIVSLFSIAGCGNNEGRHPTTVPSYEAYRQTRELELMAYWSPPPTYQHYEWVKDCGFNSIVIDAKYDCRLNMNNQPATEPLQQVISYCSQLGLEGYISVNKDEGLVGRLTDEFKDEEGFAGIYVDEPISLEQINLVGRNIDTFKSIYPNKNFLTTLTGFYDKNGNPYSFEEIIHFYLDAAGDDVNWVAFDFYPLLGTSPNNYLISNPWLSVLHSYGTETRNNGVNLLSFISTHSIKGLTVRKPTEQDMKYQAYVSLAFGAKGIGYFCYQSPYWPSGDDKGEFSPADSALLYPDYSDMYNYDGYERTERWYYAQSINDELTKFDHVYLSYDWKGTLCYQGSNAKTTANACFEEYTNKLTKHERIKSVTSTEDLIIGCLEDKDGYQGFMAVNFSDPYFKYSNEGTIKFKDAKKAVVYIEGEKSIVNLDKGEYKFNLAPGEGIFIIPIA